MNNPGVGDTVSDRAKACRTALELRRAAVTFICSGEILNILDEECTTIYLGQKHSQIDVLRKDKDQKDEDIWQSFVNSQMEDRVTTEEFICNYMPFFLGKQIWIISLAEGHHKWQSWYASPDNHKDPPITLASNQHPLLKRAEHFQSLIHVKDLFKQCTSSKCGAVSIGGQPKRTRDIHFPSDSSSEAGSYDGSLVGPIETGDGARAENRGPSDDGPTQVN